MSARERLAALRKKAGEAATGAVGWVQRQPTRRKIEVGGAVLAGAALALAARKKDSLLRTEARALRAEVSRTVVPLVMESAGRVRKVINDSVVPVLREEATTLRDAARTVARNFYEERTHRRRPAQAAEPTGQAEPAAAV